MDLPRLALILQDALSANPGQRRAAELSLNQIQFEPQHLVRLLQIIVEASYDLAIRQLASITLKNIIAEDWAGVPSRILPEDKHVVRQNIQDLIAQVQPILRAQLGECLKTIILAELSPEQLPNLLHWVNVSLLEQQVYRALFVLRIVVLKYQSKEERILLDHIVEETLPSLLNTFNFLVEVANPSVEVADLIKLICKIFKSSKSEYTEIPRLLFDPVVFNDWMVLFLKILARPVPAEGQPEDPELRKTWGWWKVKKWTLKILSVSWFKDVNIQNPFQRNYTQRIFHYNLHLLDGIRDGGYLPDKVIILILHYLSNSISKSNMYIELRPILDDLFKVIFPLMYFGDDDQFLWEEDPRGYVMKGYDKDPYCPRAAALNFVRVMVAECEKEDIQMLVSFIFEALERNAWIVAENKNYSEIDGAFLAIGAMIDTMKHTEACKYDLEKILEQHVIPQLCSDVGHVRAKAAWVARSYATFNFSDKHNFYIALNSIVSELRHPELPVYVDFVFALDAFLKACKEYEQINPQGMELILQELRRHRNQANNEDLDFTREAMNQIRYRCSYLFNSSVETRKILSGEVVWGKPD